MSGLSPCLYCSSQFSCFDTLVTVSGMTHTRHEEEEKSQSRVMSVHGQVKQASLQLISRFTQPSESHDSNGAVDK